MCYLALRVPRLEKKMYVDELALEDPWYEPPKAQCLASLLTYIRLV
jgi:hypothetical protein